MGDLLKQIRQFFVKETVSLSIEMRSLSDFRSPEKADQFLKVLAGCSKALRPEWWSDPERPRPVKFSLEHRDDLVRQWQEPGGFFMESSSERLIWDTDRYGEYDPDGDRSRWRTALIWMSTEEERFRSKGGQDSELIRMSRDLYRVAMPVYGRCEVVVQGPYAPPLSGSDIQYSIPGIYWLNFFGPPYVEMIGRDRLMGAPCHACEPLDDGGVLLMLTPTAAESITKNGRRMAEAVKEHLGMDYFYHRTDRDSPSRMKQRTTPAFDWSKMPVPDRPAVPEQPDEVRSAEEFVHSVPALIESLKGRLAEDYVTFDYTERSIEEIDVWLAQRSQKETEANEYIAGWRDEEVEAEISAYIGEVVRHLYGGEWKVEVDERDNTAPIVRYGPGRRQVFKPFSLVREVLINGIDEAEDYEGGMYATGLASQLGLWKLTHIIDLKRKK